MYATCHPDRRYRCKGLCGPCYSRSRYKLHRTRLLRENRAKLDRFKMEGLCWRCGGRQNRPGKNYCRRCHVADRLAVRKYIRAHPERVRAITRRANAKIKTEVFNHYGVICKCCGESYLPSLTIDHINGGGNKHRRELKINRGGTSFYRWLRAQGFPVGFRTLCYNCNCTRGHAGVCNPAHPGHLD